MYHHDGEHANPWASLTILAILARENVSTEPCLFDSWKNMGKQLPIVRQVPMQRNKKVILPSLKLTAKAPENGWLEDDPFFFKLNGLISEQKAVSFRGGIC